MSLASPKRHRPPALRWLAALLLLVASPCATELLLGSIAAACDTTAAVTDCCCGERAPEPSDGDERDTRASCGCCHSFAPTTLEAALVSPLRSAGLNALDTMTGAPVDGHRERLFRPPTPA